MIFVISPLQTRRVDQLTVQVYASPEAVAVAASAIAQSILTSAIAESGKAAAIFATGRSQVQFLQHLSHPSTPVDWSQVTGFHLDEYLGIAADHPASFRQYLHQHLTRKVSLGAWHALEGDGLLPIDICQRYEQKLRANPIALCCLGVGNNGHLAFNDPGVASFDDAHWVKLVRLDRANRLQQLDSSDFDTLQAVPKYAFTLTLSAIRTAQNSLCIVYGKGKAEIVRRLLTGPVSAECPASILRSLPQATLLVDQSAISQL